MTSAQNVILKVDHLTKRFALKRTHLFKPADVVQAVDDVSFDVRRNETLGVVGESGCGKSTVARLLLGILEADAGTVEVRESGDAGTKTNRPIQMVFQDSHSSLNPRQTILMSLAFGPIAQGISKVEAQSRGYQLLAAVGLDPEIFAYRYPHELSGGQRQRVNIARALALEPRIVILDEAVSALDKSVQAQVLNLITDLKKQHGFTYVFISHDLNVVQYVSDRVMVLYLGRVVEIGPVERIYSAPLHPYTRALLAAAPSLDPGKRTTKAPLRGDPPSPVNPPSGCRFRTRCEMAETVCSAVSPELFSVDPDIQHRVACHMSIPGSGHSAAPAPRAH
jgi:peptide/nickel transport system ATP-binding protein